MALEVGSWVTPHTLAAAVNKLVSRKRKNPLVARTRRSGCALVSREAQGRVGVMRSSTAGGRAPPPRCNCRAAAMGLATAALLALLLFETSRVSASPERVLRQARHTRRRMGGSELRPFETPTDDSRLSAADITLLINSGALPSLSPPPPPSSLSPPSSRPPPTATALSASQAALVVAHGNADAQSRVNSADD